MTTPAQPHHVDPVDVTPFSFARRAWVAAPPDRVYALISEVSSIGTWSPSASEVGYDDGAGPWVGAWFGGRNRRGDRSWTSRSQVCEAEPGSRFGFVVGGLERGLVRWRWTLLPCGTGTEVAQSWQLLRPDPLLGDTADELVALRDDMASSVESTLVSLARWIAEHPGGTGTGTGRGGTGPGKIPTGPV
jgi:hypothetical protein